MCRERPASFRSDCPPSRAWYAAALAAALALACLPRAASAQTPPRGAGTPIQNALRAFIEGRYDEVDRIAARLDARDPDVVALEARAAIARGRYAQAEQMLRPVAAKAPASEAALRLGLLEQMLGRPGAAATLDKVAAVGRPRDGRRRPRARGARAEGARPFPGSQRGVSRRRGRRARRSGDQYGLGRAVPREVQQRRGGAVVPGGAPVRRAVGAGAPRLRRGDGRRQPAAVDGDRQARARDQSIGRRGPDFRRAAGDRRRTPRRGAAGAPGRARRQSVQPRGARLLAALAYIEDKDAEFEAEVGKALAVSPSYGERLPHRRRDGGAQLPLRRSGGADAAGARARSGQPAHARRSRAPSAAHRRRARRARGARSLVQDRSVQHRHVQPARDDGHARHVRDGARRRRRHADAARTRRRSSASTPWRSRTRRSPRSRSATSSRRAGRSSSRSSRSTTTSRSERRPARHDRRARRLLRPRRHDGFADDARAPGKFQWEATLWHELAHVITLQMSNQRVPRWLTEGISVYEEKRAPAGVGARRWTSISPAC